MQPELHWPNLRVESERILQRLWPLLEEDDQDKGVWLGIFGIVGPEFDCPANLQPLRDIWVHGRKNAGHKEIHRLKVAEKALRLGEYIRDVNAYALSAWQANRNRALGRKGGAVSVYYTMARFGKRPVRLIFSASGVNELADEAFCLALAKSAPWTLVKPKLLDRVVAISNNGIARKLLDL